MAWVDQNRKSKIAPVVKAVLKKYGMKGTLSIKNHSTLVLNIKSGALDLIGNFNKAGEDRYTSYGEKVRKADGELQVNPYWYEEHFTGKCKNFMNDVFAALKSDGWYDKSDIQSDYFNVAYYVDVNVGKWDKPYEVQK